MIGEPVIVAGGGTDAGRVRVSNQDSHLMAGCVFAVADGMGGHAAGEVASALVVARLAGLAERPTLRPDDVRTVLADANQAIIDSAARNPAQSDMGTTVTGLCLVQVAGSTHWLVFNIGDSRVYRFADGTLTQLTEDHSHVAELVAAGEITPREALDHPLAHFVTRALGTQDFVDPDIRVFPPTPGERFLICSDGLTRELADDLIAHVLADEPVPQAAADRLVGLALAAGGRDNVTVLVVDHVASPSEPVGTTTPRARAGG
ncbi:PP2C family protein-serine/threonine phosphatase [Actinophytocola sp.]|uniref:PP2C family protein-serine/threonine phosphatase n=1 Tax=Actinophytocola sp. TaxID=1872138 RepID=UPI002ED16F2F